MVSLMTDLSLTISDARCNPCCICGGKSSIVGLYIPYNQHSVDASEGKTRMFLYTLCERCFNDDMSAPMVEYKVQKSFEARHN